MNFLQRQVFISFIILTYDVLCSQARNLVVQSILNRLVPGGQYNCLIWAELEASDILETDVQSVNLDSDATSEAAAASLKTLQVRHQQTLVFVDKLTKIASLFSVTSNQRHVLVFVDTGKTALIDLQMLNAPLVHVQSLQSGVRQNLFALNNFIDKYKQKIFWLIGFNQGVTALSPSWTKCLSETRISRYLLQREGLSPFT